MKESRPLQAFSDFGVAIGLVEGDVHIQVPSMASRLAFIEPDEPVAIGLPSRPASSIARSVPTGNFPLAGAGITRYSLVGLGGVGKTHLALEYAYSASKQGISTVIWIDGADVRSSVMRIARAIGWASGSESGEDLGSLVQRWVSARHGHWLIVVDGLDNHSTAVDRVLPVLCRANGSGRTLVTTRSASVAAQYSDGNPIEVGPLTPDEAEKFLAFSGSTDPSARAPLFLKLHAAATSRSVQHPVPADTTAALVASLFSTAGADAQEASRIVALCAPSGVPIRLVASALNRTEVELTLAIEASGLMVLERMSLEPLEARVSMHVLVRTAVTQSSGQNELDASIESLLSRILADLASLSHEATPIERWANAAEATKHLLALPLDLCRNENAALFVNAASAVAAQLARDAFDLQAARRLSERALRAAESSALRQQIQIEAILLEIERLEDGRNFQPLKLEELLAKQREAARPSLELMLTRRRYAETISEKGRAASAIGELTTLVTEYRAMLGDNHPETLTTMHILAYAEGMGGDYDEVARILTDCLAARMVVLGPHHPDTLSTRYNLAFAMMRLGDLEAAQAEFETVRDLRSELVGPDHPTVLITEGSLANAIGLDGNHELAALRFASLLDRFVRVRGSSHPLTVRTWFYKLKWAALSVNPVSILGEIVQMRQRAELVLEHSDPLLVEIAALERKASASADRS